MNRSDFQLHLNAYIPHDEDERSMLARMRHFVEGNEDCFLRSLAIGHITTSCWIVDPARERTLLTWHKRLDRWLQMGGHIEDGDESLLGSALREAREESGLTTVRIVSEAIFDLDVHTIPARKSEPEHDHYDVRFLFEADPESPLIVSAESRDVAWVKLADVVSKNADASMRRMVDKTLSSRSQLG
ncbi:MAG: NUDIX hydrolase [Acidobacteriota bacterium]